MSDAFFQDLRLPDPDVHLGVGSGTHAEQTGKVMIAYEKILRETRPDLIVVVGDVNSTMACTLAASKVQYLETNKLNGPNELNKPNRPIVAHLEAGLRSFDRTMPEEINRIVTDALADILWTPSPDADENLLREGVSPEKIHRVGNIMIDSLEMMRGSIESKSTYKQFELYPGEYGVVTLHRPSNVDDQDVLNDLCAKLVRISRDLPLVFPIHPRTRKNLEQNGLMKLLGGANDLHLTEPLSYIPFMNLVFNCRMAITDSGGLQEETTYLGIPCLTMRPNTERPITVTQGTNRLCTSENLDSFAIGILSGKTVKTQPPEYWDGKTAGRVVTSIRDLIVQ
jgi:UDP-N-acetylglucosamine 2-epimerase (non-hydrolysing)